MSIKLEINKDEGVLNVMGVKKEFIDLLKEARFNLGYKRTADVLNNILDQAFDEETRNKIRGKGRPSS